VSDPQATVPLGPVLDRYIRLHSDLTLTVTQLQVLLAERTRERDEALEKLAATDSAPAPWPYAQPETIEQG
jgi:hypothetical protein